MPSSTVKQQEVSHAIAQAALDAALERNGAPYQWAGNGPDGFDCSGLIVWAYRQALGRSDLFYDGYEVVSDVTMQTLYDENVGLIDPGKVDQVVPDE